MLRCKIHRARVTDSNVDYEGSVAIDSELMETAGILPYEKVEIYDITNGNRLQTYAIPAGRGNGEVCINGAAARLAKKGDLVIIASYSVMEEDEALAHRPVLVYVNPDNSVKRVGPASEKAAAGRPS